MSAYHVPDLHINALLSWALKSAPALHADGIQYDLTQPEDFARVGHILRVCNNASMDARYGDAPQGYLPNLVDVARLSPINIVSACSCFAYQACEFAGWEVSDGKQIIDQISAAALYRVPGYDQIRLIQDTHLRAI